MVSSHEPFPFEVKALEGHLSDVVNIQNIGVLYVLSARLLVATITKTSSNPAGLLGQPARLLSGV
jgi:hypothetical protein